MDKIESKVEIERDKVDTFIITACISLIGAFAIIISVKKPSDTYISYSYLISLLTLIASLLFSLWHKYRFPKRQELYKKEVNKILHEISADIADFGGNILIPLKKRKLNELTLNEKNTSIKELEKNINNEHDEHAKKVIMTYLEKMNFKTKEKQEEIYNKPLNEKYSIIKYRLDKISHGLRYVMFTIGILFFFVSIFLTLLK